MMDKTDAPSPVLFFQTLSAYQRSNVLKAAIELDVFTSIGKEPATAGEIAGRCKTDQRGMRILCDYLTILGFREKWGAICPNERFGYLSGS